jgi:hypothetical protein
MCVNKIEEAIQATKKLISLLGSTKCSNDSNDEIRAIVFDHNIRILDKKICV